MSGTNVVTQQDQGGRELGDTLRALDELDAAEGRGVRGVTQQRSIGSTARRTVAGLADMPAPVRRRGPSEEALSAARRLARERLALRARRIGELADGATMESRPSPSSLARPGTTVTRETVEQYLARGQRLFQRFRREMGVTGTPEDISAVEFVNWLLSLKPSLKSSTWRLYRQCALYFVQGMPSDDMEDAVAMLETDIIERSTEISTEKREVKRQSSALKEKRFAKADLERILAYLAHFCRSRWSQALADWLRAGILTGLRPVEWATTDLEILEDRSAAYGRRAYLYVLSAKATNGRGTGVVRTLDLSGFPDEELGAVRRMVDRARLWLEEGRCGEAQDCCSHLLYNVTSRLWPKRRVAYALYSCRHQAIANWKAQLTPAEVSALAGHGVTSTAVTAYGKRRSAWGPDERPPAPRPVPEELRLVRDRIQMFEQRIQLEIQAGLRKPGDTPEYPVG